MLTDDGRRSHWYTISSQMSIRLNWACLLILALGAILFDRAELLSHFGIIGLFGYRKGGTSWMRNMDWSTLDIGNRWKRGVVLFKSNCIILRHYLSIDAKHII